MINIRVVAVVIKIAFIVRFRRYYRTIFGYGHLSVIEFLKNILGATMHSKADDKTSGDESKSASVQEVFRSGTPSVEQSQRQVL